MIHEIHITQGMIDRSICGHPYKCIISHAMSILYPKHIIITIISHVEILHVKKIGTVYYKNSYKVENYIQDYDANKPFVKPCTLLVDDKKLTLDIKYDS